MIGVFMKLISFVIPAYNSEAYLHIAIDSLLIAGNDIEIIIINDGSKDQTLSVANRYQKKYPNIVKVIDQENGGHGSGINAGLKNATGKYFKVVDSDDWVDGPSLIQLIKKLKEHIKNQQDVDLYITNFVYEHVQDDTTFERDYSVNFPIEKIFNWNETLKKFKYSKTLLMHALIYRTQILKDMNLELPRHTFYVDNLYSYAPLPYVKSIYYMKLPLYRYFIGRADQSITLKNITKRYQQQIKVFELMQKAYPYSVIQTLPKGLRAYMKHCLAAILMITQMFTGAEDSIDRRKDLNALWRQIKEMDVSMYRYLKYRSLNVLVNFFPWKLKGYIMVKGYLYLAKKIKLG
jgi:glycosyltransferase involved in cell wall biosynthesis